MAKYKTYQLHVEQMLLVRNALIERGGTPDMWPWVKAPRDVRGDWYEVRDWAFNGQFYNTRDCVDPSVIYWPVPDTDGSPQECTDLEAFVRAVVA